MPPPIRFLGSVLGGWICFRAMMLVPGWTAEIEAGAQAAPAEVVEQAELPRHVASAASAPTAIKALKLQSWAAKAPTIAPSISEGGATKAATVSGELVPSFLPQAADPPAAKASAFAQPQPLQRLSSTSRWSMSAWALVRRGDAPALAAGGMLGGSQAGARLNYRINGERDRPLALSARLYSPLRDRRGTEAALGIEWQPVAAVPLRLLAERRQAIGSDGRSAFALMAHGGVSAVSVGPLRLDGYAQAGAVGLKSRDLFVDGGATLGLPLGERITVGGGIWGAAQPRLSRLDAGPSLSITVPLEGRNLRISADWRLRLAGDAFPTSGPAITLGSDF